MLQMHSHFTDWTYNKNITFSKRTCQRRNLSIEEYLSLNYFRIKLTAREKGITLLISMTRMGVKQIQIEVKVKDQEDLMPAKDQAFLKLQKHQRRARVPSDRLYFYCKHYCGWICLI